MRGVVAFQEGNDAVARAYFVASSVACDCDSNTRSDIERQYASDRHIFLAEHRWEDACELRDHVLVHYGTRTLQASVATNWAIATMLSTDTGEAQAIVRRYLDENRACAARFAHQATIHMLFEATQYLGLPLELRRLWIRWVLYENAFAMK